MVSRKKQLLADTKLYAIGDLGSRLIAVLLVPFYTRYLSTSEYGAIDLILVTGSLIIPVIYLQIEAGIYRFLLDKNVKREEIISTSIFFSILAQILAFSLAIAAYKIFHFSIDYLYIILIMYFLLAQNNLFLQILRGLGKVKLYAIVGIVYTICQVLFNIYFIAFNGKSYNGIILASIISFSIVIFICLFAGKLLPFFKIKAFNIKTLSILLVFSLPLLPNAINWWIMNASDRYIISYYLDFQTLGIYAIAYKIAGVLFIFNTIFYKAWQTSAITEYNSSSRNRYYSEIFHYLMIFQIIIVFMGIISVKFVMYFLVGDDFFESWKYIPFLFIGSMFLSFSSFFGTGYLSAKKTRDAITTSVFGAIINIIINIIFIPFIGIYAAAISTMLAYLALWLSRIYTTKISVIGLGYVGLPIALEFAKKYQSLALI